MIESYKAFWGKSFDFRGKTSRIDYWLVAAANALIAIVLGVVGLLLASAVGESAAAVPLGLLIVYAVATIVPNISIYVRRFRDAGFSPWLVLLGLVPYVGGLILIILCLQPTKRSLF